MVGVNADGVTFQLLHTGASVKAKPISKHVDHLKRWRQGESKDKVQESLLPAALQSQQWEVDKIVAERKSPDGREYLVLWKGEDDPTWEPEANLECPEKLEAYLQQRAAA